MQMTLYFPILFVVEGSIFEEGEQQTSSGSGPSLRLLRPFFTRYYPREKVEFPNPFSQRRLRFWSFSAKPRLRASFRLKGDDISLILRALAQAFPFAAGRQD